MDDEILAGVPAEVAAAYREVGIRHPAVIRDFARYGCSAEDAIAWCEALRADSSLQEENLGHLAAAWLQEGFTPAEAAEWQTVDYPHHAARWKERLFGPADARLWQDAFFGAEEALRWRDAGLTPVEAAYWARRGYFPNDAADETERRLAAQGVVLDDEDSAPAAPVNIRRAANRPPWVVQSVEGHGGTALLTDGQHTYAVSVHPEAVTVQQVIGSELVILSRRRYDPAQTNGIATARAMLAGIALAKAAG